MKNTMVLGYLLIAGAVATATATTNVTTNSASTTTGPTTAPTTNPPTTPFTGGWQISNTEGLICMIVDFTGELTHPRPVLPPLTVSIPAPKQSQVTNSKCDDDSATFVLKFSHTTHSWKLTLHFSNTGNTSTYALDEVSAELHDIGIKIASGDKKMTFLRVPDGSYYSCPSFDETIPKFEINLKSVIFQPFVQHTTHHNLGNASVCIPSTTPASTTMTTPATNVTTPATNVTTPATNVTTPASNVTTPTSNVTTHATTPVTNVTTPTSNVTTHATTHATNVTTPTSNVTTPTANVTTKPTHTTMTTHAITTQPPDVDWTVKDKKGKKCMLMGFTGTISHKFSKTNLTVNIPKDGNSTKSTCNPKIAVFILEFNASNFQWQLDLNFTNNEKIYTLGMMKVLLHNMTGALNSSGSLEKKCLQAPVGDYYHCSNLTEAVQTFDVTLKSPVFQPFADKSGGEQGKAFKCGSALPSNGPNVGLIVGLVVGIVVVITCLGIVYLYMKRVKTDKSYSSLN